MSILVGLPQEAYRADGFDGFTGEGGFRIANARALMWMSQLAYEVRDARNKVDPVLARWGLRAIALVANETSGLPVTSTRCIIAAGHGATIAAFAGTDPLAVGNWITNFNLGRRARELHRGFESAVAAVWPQICAALSERAAAERPLFIVGHSLGGALAVIAAQRLVRELGVEVTGVYTFGMPRVGGAEFFAAYHACGLAGVTYRLVHGLDIVPTVPPTFLGFRHVGRMLACERGGRFLPAAQLSSIESDDPPFVPTLKSGYAQRLRELTTWKLPPPSRPGWLGNFQRLLSPPIGDHLPDRYCHALDDEALVR
jgi:triacylglycerol lipase